MHATSAGTRGEHPTNADRAATASANLALILRSHRGRITVSSGAIRTPLLSAITSAELVADTGIKGSLLDRDANTYLGIERLVVASLQQNKTVQEIMDDIRRLLREKNIMLP